MEKRSGCIAIAQHLDLRKTTTFFLHFSMSFTIFSIPFSPERVHLKHQTKKDAKQPNGHYGVFVHVDEDGGA